MSDPVVDRLELDALVDAYARAVDRRDANGLLAVFEPDAELWVYRAGRDEPEYGFRGHAELPQVMERVGRFPATFHFVGNRIYHVDGDTATGEVYCIAHHLMAEGDGSAHVMYIRYQDQYVRNGDGWRIADRRLVVDWTEKRSGTRR